MVMYVIEVSDFNSEVKFDLQGHLRPPVTSEATKRGNMYLDNRVIDVAYIKYELISDLRGHHSLGGCHGLEATKRRNMHIDAWVTEVADFKFNVISDIRIRCSDTVSSLLRHCS